jgi:TRAP-type C4-dicarboxylate transport system substrate-binding protein
MAFWGREKTSTKILRCDIAKRWEKLMPHRISSFEELWTTYNTLQWEMMELKRQAIVDHMENARHYINGLSDGWYDFKKQFDKMEEMWSGQFQGESKERFDAIKDALDRWF